MGEIQKHRTVHSHAHISDEVLMWFCWALFSHCLRSQSDGAPGWAEPAVAERDDLRAPAFFDRFGKANYAVESEHADGDNRNTEALHETIFAIPPAHGTAID